MTAVFRASVRARYDAALRFPEATGSSARVHGHGYTVEAVLEAETVDASGYVADFDRLEAALRAVAGELDHRVLNDLEPFDGRAPSAEHQAEYFYRRMAGWIESNLRGEVRLARVRVIQEPATWAEYEG